MNLNDGSTTTGSDRAEQPEDNKPSGYFSVGFHRLLGGFYHNIVYTLAGAILFIAIMPIVLPIYMPYPEIQGYANIVYGLLGFVFGIFDFGSTHGAEINSNTKLNDGLLRFVGQHAIMHPAQAIKFIQLFAWFQMITGVIQITLISCVVLWWLPFTSLAHMSWFIIAYIVIQFPGCTQLFDSVFRGFQRFDSLNSYTFVKDQLLKPALQIIAVIIGRVLGSQVPALGELMGATIAWIASLWIAEILGFLYGGLVFRLRLAKATGLSIRDLFHRDFDRAIFRSLMTFSGKLWIQQLAGQFITMLNNLIIIALIPSYGIWIGLIDLGGTFTNLTAMQGQMMRNTTAPFSEAFLNGKKRLFQYHVFSLIKYFGFVSMSMIVPCVLFLPVVLKGFIAIVPALSPYAPLTYMLPLLLITQTIYGPLISLAGRLLPACDRPAAGVVLSLLTSPLYIVFLLLFVSLGMTWEAILWASFLASMAEVIAKICYFHARVFKIPIYSKGVAWQSLIAPSLAAGISMPVLWLLILGIIPILDLGILAIIVLSLFLVLFCIFIYPIFIFTPLYAFLGGFDEDTIRVFDVSIQLAGPSKFMMQGMSRIIHAVIPRSPLHGRFPLPFAKESEKERAELDAMKVVQGNSISN